MVFEVVDVIKGGFWISFVVDGDFNEMVDGIFGVVWKV